MNKDLLKGITRTHMLMTLLFTVFLIVSFVSFHKLHIIDTWPAMFAIFYFFIFEFKKEKIITIFAGAFVGLLIGLALPSAMGCLVPIFGAENSLYLFVGIAIFFVILLGPVAPALFNPITFTYAYLSVINAKSIPSNWLNWLLLMIVGGGILVGGIYGLNCLLRKLGNSNVAETETYHH